MSLRFGSIDAGGNRNCRFGFWRQQSNTRRCPTRFGAIATKRGHNLWCHKSIGMLYEYIESVPSRQSPEPVQRRTGALLNRIRGDPRSSNEIELNSLFEGACSAVGRIAD